MQASLQYATSSFSERKSASSLLVSAAAAVASEKVPILGSSTACVLTLDQSTGIASIANLGDSGVLIGRWQKGKANFGGRDRTCHRVAYSYPPTYFLLFALVDAQTKPGSRAPGKK